MIYDFLRYLFNIFIFLFRLFEKLLDKPNIIILYPFLYILYLFCAFTYGLTGTASALLCTFIAWVPFTVYLVELKFFKKQHGVSFYFAYGFLVSFVFLFFDLSGFSIRPFLHYLFWGYFCFMSQVVSVFGWSVVIFVFEYFRILYHFSRFVFFFVYFIFYSFYQALITFFLFFHWCLKECFYFFVFLFSFFK